LDILSEIVFGGETSRAYQEIVKNKKLPRSIRAGLQAQRGPSLFTLFAIHPANVAPGDLEKAIYAQVGAIKQSPPSEDELQRVKTRRRASRYRSAGIGGLESMLG